MDQRQQRRDEILAECKRRQIKVERVNNAFLLTAPGMELLCSDLAILDANELRPHQPRKPSRP